MKMKLKVYALLLFVALLSITVSVNAQTPIGGNHELIPIITKDFVDGAAYHKVDYKEKFSEIKAIKLIVADPNFIGSVNDGVITLNSQLALYPYLMKVIIFRQLGKHYGLKDEKRVRLIMSDNYQLNPYFELVAYRMANSNIQEKIFFEKLANKYKLNTQL